MGEPVYFTDVGQCELTQALAAESRRGCWSLWDYETDGERTAPRRGRMF